MNSCPHRWDWWPDTPQTHALGLGVPALRYRDMGYKVLPLEPGGKDPHRMLGTRMGVYQATADVNLITGWWQADPSAGIGVRTGSESRLVVVDLDLKAGKNGAAAFWEWLTGEGLELPETPYVTTPSGGRHLWLRWPWWRDEGRKEHIVLERGSILPGVDIKGDGGYVVAPPSMRMVHVDGNDGERGGEIAVPYMWDYGCPCSVPYAPFWMASWLATAPSAGNPLPYGEVPEIEDARKNGVQRGMRNISMYRLACSIFRRWGSTGPDAVTEVTEQLAVVWSMSDRTGMSWREVLVAIESARRFIERRIELERQWSISAQPWVDRHGT